MNYKINEAEIQFVFSRKLQPFVLKDMKKSKIIYFTHRLLTEHKP